jgi:hypothetical protein
MIEQILFQLFVEILVMGTIILTIFAFWVSALEDDKTFSGVFKSYLKVFLKSTTLVLYHVWFFVHMLQCTGIVLFSIYSLNGVFFALFLVEIITVSMLEALILVVALAYVGAHEFMVNYFPPQLLEALWKLRGMIMKNKLFLFFKNIVEAVF